MTAAGCGTHVPNTLTVATAWPAARRDAAADAFSRWASEHRPGARIDWVRLAPGDDLESVARHRHAPDVLLGGPAGLHARLSARGLVAEDGWAPLGPVEPPGTAGQVADPRRDPAVLADLRGVLASKGWPAGYATLVRSADGITDEGRPAPVAEGVSVLAGTRDPELARALLKVAETVQPAAGVAPSSTSPEADELLADLLGSTLVDARDERLAACEALGTHAQAGRAARWMDEPPPWPPASVAKILGRKGGMSLVETLAGQVAPEPDVRAWLLRSWIAPPRTVDLALLDELARAGEGRLAREPRFRAWLRGEWTAWARQRYRRVARLTELPGTAAP